MPHSENTDTTTDTTTMTPQVNGESPSSAFLSHLTSYPVISDSITTFKSNPYGAKSLSLTSSGYEKIGKPLLPYLSTPYSFISPYISKADSLGDSTLSTLDQKFPVVKKPTGELYDDAQSVVFFPLKKTTEGKDYVWKTYSTEVKKVGGDGGIVTYGKAAVSTGLIISSETLSWLGAFLAKKKGEVKDVTNEKLG